MSQEETIDTTREDNAFRILIATDNHIGYLERDPIRGQDSFRTFEEILQIAEIEKVDFILLGGDLFHQNRPTRSCLYETMKMLRRHCFGSRESKVWIASDQSVNFADEFCTANYLDENYNISMPVFSIHGNHDDPSGVGNLCALNLLSVSGMINYFGASSSVEDVTIYPILMQKGHSKLALYGLGNIREERLHRQWRSGHVKFMRPEDDGTADSWKDCFNMFVFHQNRARHGPTSHIPEEFLDGFLDLVFWGHEHECRIHPEEYERFSITQPGSSVATSLSEGEAEPKHVGLLTIEGGSYSLDKIRLKTIRPLQFTTVSLSRVPSLRPTDTKGIQLYLEGVVESLIEKAKLDWEDQQQQSPYQLHQLLGEDPNLVMPIPLVRIRVDYSGGYETFNPQQFGQKFINRVANPKDILKFQKLRSESQTRMKPSEMASDVSIAIPERLDNLKVEDLVSELLSRDLAILPETGLEEAVMSLVEKSDKESIRTFVKKAVTQTRDSIAVIPDNLDLEYIKRISTETKQSQDQPRRNQVEVGNAVPPTPRLQGSTNANTDGDEPSLPITSRNPLGRIQRDPETSEQAPLHTNRRAASQSYVISDEEMEDLPPLNPTTKRSANRKRPAPSNSPPPSLSSTQSAPPSNEKRRRVLPSASSQKKR
jgi:double-strand break repair protein MRE11